MLPILYRIRTSCSNREFGFGCANCMGSSADPLLFCVEQVGPGNYRGSISAILFGTLPSYDQYTLTFQDFSIGHLANKPNSSLPFPCCCLIYTPEWRKIPTDVTLLWNVSKLCITAVRWLLKCSISRAARVRGNSDAVEDLLVPCPLHGGCRKEDLR